MTPDKLIVLVTGLAAIAFVYWFFLMKKETARTIEGSEATITVDGGYTPNVISIPRGKQFTLHFLRKDPYSCLDEVVLPDFKVRKALPLNKTTDITIFPEKTGEFTYSCGMNMFRGKIIVT